MLYYSFHRVKSLSVYVSTRVDADHEFEVRATAVALCVAVGRE